MRFGLPKKAKRIFLLIAYRGLGELETQLQVFWRFAHKMKWVAEWHVNLHGQDVPPRKTLIKMMATWRKNKRVSYYVIGHNEKDIFEFGVKS